jgi:hypothetical protein
MAQNRFNKLRWESVDEIIRSNAEKAPSGKLEPLGAGLPAAVEEHPLVKLLRRTNVPRHPDPNASVREEAEFLLQAASEVEHQFIVQYLYAYFSLDLAAGGEVALKCKNHLLPIAEEEMGHLLTVQNALLMIGSPPYLERERYPPPDPQPFPLELEPASLHFVSRFLVAESPADAVLPDDLGDLKATIDHVGALYVMIYWLFQDSDSPQEPWLLPPEAFPSGRHLQPGDYNADTAQIQNQINVAWDWGAGDGIHVLPPSDVALDTPAKIADATRRALFDIAVQGEGPVEAGPNPPKETSHYHRLLGIYNSIKAAPADLKFALDVPVDPHTEPVSTGNPEEERGLITDSAALLHARFFNLRYSMLMLEIALSVITPRSKVVDGEPVKGTLAARAVSTGMRRGVGALAKKLVTLPLKSSQSGVAPPFAGAPFALREKLFPKNEKEGWKHLLSLIDESKMMIDNAGGAPSDEIKALLQRDHEFRPFVMARINELVQ